MEKNIPVTILVMVLATQASRLAPLFLMSKKDLSPAFERWLQHIPIAVLSALIVPDFFTHSATGIEINRNYAIAGLACLAVGLKTKNLVLTTVAGVVIVALLRHFF